MDALAEVLDWKSTSGSESCNRWKQVSTAHFKSLAGSVAATVLSDVETVLGESGVASLAGSVAAGRRDRFGRQLCFAPLAGAVAATVVSVVAIVLVEICVSRF